MSILIERISPLPPPAPTGKTFTVGDLLEIEDNFIKTGVPAPYDGDFGGFLMPDEGENSNTG